MEKLEDVMEKLGDVEVVAVYRVFADIVLSCSWRVVAVSEEDAIAHIKKCLEKGVRTLEDCDLSQPTEDDLFDWQAVEEEAS